MSLVRMYVNYLLEISMMEWKMSNIRKIKSNYRVIIKFLLLSSIFFGGGCRQSRHGG